MTGQTSSNDRVAAVVAWGAVAAAVALVVVMLVMAWGDQPDERSRDAAGPSTTSADAAPFAQSASPPPGPEPGGAPQVIAAAEQVLTAYNDRDSEPLRAWACDRADVTDDLFAGFSDTVRFARDGAPRIVGFTAEVPFVVRDEDRERSGAMRLRWDGQRWCFVTAVAEQAS